jgi:agmatinase
MRPPFALPATFLGQGPGPEDAAYSVVGIPFDLGTTNRAGARFGPLAIRQASRMLADGANPANWRDPLELPFADRGDFDLPLGDLAASLAAIERQAAAHAHLIALGGDHTITLALLRALARRLGPVALIHFDAHVDTWPDNFGQRFAHGSTFRHAIEEGLIDPRRTIQIGIRSPVQKTVYDWTVGTGVRIVTAEDTHGQGVDGVAAAIRAAVGDHATYLSFDIDALDPSQAPGTGTPEIGGLLSWQALAILRRLEGVRFAGMDLVEVSPPYDMAEITALAGATLVWQYLCLLPQRPG